MVARAIDFAKPFRVDDGRKFRLKDVDPGDTGGLHAKDEAREWLRQGVRRLAELQEKLYAQDSWGVLLIFQAMDAAGKDGAIKHVMSGVNPQGTQAYSFKGLPGRGRIGIFTRSSYEEVLVVRVHPEFLAGQKLPPARLTKGSWQDRFQDINHFEEYLDHNGIVVRKFFLHVSSQEQKKRFLSRLEEPEKNWKFSAQDAREREHWDAYMDAYQDMIRSTATPHAPWYVVPADNKWFTRLTVAAAVIDTLEDLDLHFPEVDKAKRKALAAARAILEGSKRA